MLTGSDGGGGADSGSGGGGGGGGNTGGGGFVDGGGSGSTLLSFAVFGDARPGSPNQTSSYPTAILSSIFSHAQAKGAQFAVGTGDYMFASNATEVTAQVQLLEQAQAHFTGPIYHTMGNHECTGYTASNCPSLTETPNVQAFLKLLPSGVATPWYRVDYATAMGKAKFLFVAANAWTTAQDAWLKAQLADPTAYTFIVRHEPSYDATAPGVTPSDQAAANAPYTIMLLGHTHAYRRLDPKHVISGNAGAPISNGGSYGFLLFQQQADGTLTASEIDEATGNASDTWRIDATGKAL